jgi:diaminohydroxyphosphoribosylaminopyrimidine deaminase/5-amino-6-(5-phosphoribosylamino)uracil reductase
LEPHSYQGRTPPCTEALIRARVARVVCGALDPNPQVHGEGVRQLRAAGIEVRTGLLEAEVRELNLGFEKRMTQGLPRVVVKLAASLDGRVALDNGVSRWITSEAARADVQRLRAQASAVLTGIETVLADDPQLNVRDQTLELLGRQPLRVVLDTRLRTPATARLFQTAGETLIFTAAATHGDAEAAAMNARAEALRRAGAQVIAGAVDARGHVELEGVWRELGRRQCNEVLVEAGPMLAGRILQLGMADELIVYYAPLALGPQAKAMAMLPSLQRLEEARRYELKDLARVGPDVKLVFRPPGPGTTPA